MAVIRAVTIGLTLGLLLPAPARAGECNERAQALLRKAEAVSMSRRAPLILETLGADEALGCGVVPARHWTAPASLPEGCAEDALDLCAALDGLPVAAQVSRDVAPDLYVRVQLAAARLSDAGHLGRPLKRLMQLLLLSDAVRRGG